MIHPAHRRRGFGRALAVAAVAAANPRPVRIWAHGDLPAAARLAAVTGFTRVRSLLLMGRSLREAPPAPRLPTGVSVRTFAPGRDEDAWLALNAAAFADHPEQGAWTRRDLEQREAQPWFDPDGFFLAVRGGRLVGFHWTKVHEPGTEEATADGQRTGEVYVVGVAPAEQGTGLGRALTLTGLDYLRSREIPAVILYVDGENAAAIRMYTTLGFTHIATDVMYEHAQAAEGRRAT